MPTIKVDQLKPGYILKAHAYNLHGQVLLPSGTRVAEHDIPILKAWGVHHLEVQEECDSPSDPADPQKSDAEFQRLFRRQDMQHPGAAELAKACLQRKTAQNRTPPVL